MQYLPVANTDACVTALMILIAIVTAEIVHLPLFVDVDLVYEADAET